ncbi:hypothetical protein T10_4153 [Trichinella papuae]|uniref:Uncharacterized protein n=1 Tax=Trichinella papuae TaxID=268474 RepID=A0A0V1MXS5_9BILA|nr:hypothetical protein T10_4153 [Trichinella papuae]
MEIQLIIRNRVIYSILIAKSLKISVEFHSEHIKSNHYALCVFCCAIPQSATFHTETLAKLYLSSNMRKRVLTKSIFCYGVLSPIYLKYA